jgi:hypothetical protein
MKEELVNQDMMADQVNLAFLEKEDLRVEEDSLVLQDHQEIMESVVFQVKKGLLVRKEIRENLIHLVILASQVNKEILGLQDHLENKDEKEQLDSQVQKVLQG